MLLFLCAVFSAAQEQNVLSANSRLPLEERIELLATSLPRSQEIVDECRLLLEEARLQPDKKYMLRLYRILMLNLRKVGTQHESAAYADSVLLYINQVSDPAEIGMAYYQLGSFHTNDFATSHSYRYKAIPYFEKSPEHRYRIAEMYYLIAADYLVINDYDNLKKMEEQLFELHSKYSVQEALVFAHSVKSVYYGSLYLLNKSETAMRDSSVFYERKAIEVFEKIPHTPSQLLHESIAYNYYNIAVSLLLHNTPENLEKALEYIEKALLHDPYDLVVEMSYHYIRGNVFLKQRKLKEAETEAQSLFDILSKLDKEEFPIEYKDMYELFAGIAEAKGDYREALKYKQLTNELLREIFNAERYEAIESVKTQYEVSKKEDEIARLTEVNRFQKRISYLYLVLGVLLIAGLLFFIYLLLLKRENVIAQLKIAQLEKDEAEAQILLEVEKLKSSELEKYEALLDIQVKEQELTEQEQELKLLFSQKEKLEEQILEQAKKFETHFEQIQTKLNSRSLSGFLEEMKQQIHSKLGNNSRTREYLHNIDKINDAMLLKINSQFEGNLALVHIRYCVCFIIGMRTKDISDYLDVEVSSVHTTRYRLKQRLKLENEDLDIYFKSLLSS